MLSVKKYDTSYKLKWNDFVKNSKNGTFLFDRNFMEYHQDRFEDASLVVLRDTKWVALLPANKVNNVMYSHQGLSYGGVIFDNSIKSFYDKVEVYKSILYYCFNNGINEIVYKPIPVIYNNKINQEIDIIFSWVEAKLYKRLIYSVVDNQSGEFKINRNRTRLLKRANDNGLFVKEIEDIAFFWDQILSENLKQRFNTEPVHTLLEIKFLKNKFPDNIKFYGTYDTSGKLKAGAVIFVFSDIAHFQYSSGEEDRTNGALDLLFVEIISKYRAKKYVSLGTSNDPNTNKISKGLLYWKNSLDSSNISQSVYSIDTKNYQLLNDRFF